MVLFDEKIDKLSVLILAGGQGRRLRPLTNKHPKPLIEVLGEPILNRIIEVLQKTNIHTNIVVPPNDHKIEQFLESKYYHNYSIYFNRSNSTFGAFTDFVNNSRVQNLIVINGDMVFRKSDFFSFIKNIKTNNKETIIGASTYSNNTSCIIFFDANGVNSYSKYDVNETNKLRSAGIRYLTEKVIKFLLYDKKAYKNFSEFLNDMCELYPVRVHYFKYAININTPKDLILAERILEIEKNG